MATWHGKSKKFGRSHAKQKRARPSSGGTPGKKTPWFEYKRHDGTVVTVERLSTKVPVGV